ncbi:hypothetical protein SDC9_149178 [bioreactor metagenome]|uniref:Uncharacterized protein n=1 Tax=bioreactor metagenome TaxID=1076179 RepID=A0A645EIW8_9ZZZZ
MINTKMNISCPTVAKIDIFADVLSSRAVIRIAKRVDIAGIFAFGHIRIP